MGLVVAIEHSHPPSHNIRKRKKKKKPKNRKQKTHHHKKNIKQIPSNPAF
jgi:hypothetical protein